MRASLLVLLLVACGEAHAPPHARDSGPVDDDDRPDGALVDGGRAHDAGPSTDAGGAPDAGPDACARDGEPVFSARPALEGAMCRFRRDLCRDDTTLLVCLGEGRAGTGANPVCARCETDDECELEYRSYGLRAREARCTAEGVCALPPPPSGEGECDTTAECQLSTGSYACVDHRCVRCTENADCSTSREGVCLCDGTCGFPIPPGP